MIALQFVIAVILSQAFIVLMLHCASKSGKRDDRQSRIAMVNHCADAVIESDETTVEYLERMLLQKR